MFKYTKHTLKKLETLFEEVGYTVRYEKGNFQSGYCLVENRKVAVINKFFETEGRINTLIDILGSIEVPEEGLTDPSRKILRQVMRAETSEPEDNA
ncbi:MAG: hypothetical protein KDC43_26050 [Saprospiraceae bacterium]|nr:hypothetical protein [Saprospiraceae bacterium]MCB0627284.1 hypothetical protein [Saprospiraceae bacterium]MCB0678856.1 hypothetical protein [Saprospiraceae bacterium]MCB0680702.1 hypothetical protein [Saprospiraceae bacterium]